jgi:PAS domain S-box-containing protein
MEVKMEKTADEVKRLQSCINDLISVLALPAIWSGNESSQIVGTLLDVLLAMLRLDFAYARLSDPSDGPTIEVVRLRQREHPSPQPQEVGRALDHWLSGDQTAARYVVPNPAGEGEVSIASFFLGLQDKVGVLVAGSRRADFPTDIERLLLRVAANQTGIGLQEARRSGDQKRVAEALERRVAERTRQLTAVNEGLRRSEAYLAEAQRLSDTGSFGWRPSTGDILWSDETFRIFQYERTTTPTVELILRRTHPEDAAFVKNTIELAAQHGKDLDFEYRLLMPGGSVKYVHVVARAISDESGGIEFVGSVMNVTEQHQSKATLEEAFDEIKRSEDRLRLVIDTIPGMVWSGLPDGTFDFVNEPWLRYLGCTWEELSAQGGLRSVVHPDDLEGSDAKWRATRAAGRHIDHELRMRRADGQYRWFLTRALPLRDDLGNIVKWYGTATDIEDRKRVEMLLGGEKRVFEMIARGESRALILDTLCRLIEELASGCFSSILLLDPNTSRLRLGAAPSLPPECAEAIDGIVIGPSVGSCGTAAYLKEQVIVSDIATDPLWADFRELALANGLRACWSTPILSSEDRVLGTFAIYYGEARSPTPQNSNAIGQITHLASIALERAQAAQALQQQANLLEQAHDAILVWEFPQTIVYWNRGAEQLYGFSREEAIGRPSHELLNTQHAGGREQFDAVLERDGEWAGELSHTTKDGRILTVESRHVLMRETEGRRLVLETNRDITERKRAAEALRQAQADLAHASRVTTMGELTASLAHEVNQPITAAVTNANTCVRWLASETPNIEEAREAAIRSAKDGTRAAEIISRIRLLFKKGTPEREPVDLNEVLREMMVLLRGEATRYSVSIRTELAADLPQLMADRIQLQQVMLNLMMNSIDAMKYVDGDRELTIKSEAVEDAQLLISVSDTGVGLPAQQANDIFNAFFTTKLQGTGLGLSISRSIVESHGGRLWVDTNCKHGATFLMTLPTGAK